MIDEIAEDWLEKLSRGCSREEYKAFDAWYASSEANRNAFERAKILQAQLDALASSPAIVALRKRILANTLPAESDASENSPSSLVSHLVEVIRKITRFLLRCFESTVVRAAAGASLVGAILLTGLMLFTPAKDDIASYATRVGEQKEITLMDGTIVTLDTSTRINVKYSRKTRTIELIYGQGYFNVKNDSKRPFIVRAASGQVKVVGTVFTVNQNNSTMVVTLKEGALEVLPANSQEAQTDTNDKSIERLSPGEQLSISPDKGVVRVKLSRLDEEFQWVSGNLVFNSTRLEEVISQISRYTDKKITLTDPTLQDIKVNAVFHVGELESFMKALTLTLDIDVVRSENGDYVLKAIAQPME